MATTYRTSKPRRASPDQGAAVLQRLPPPDERLVYVEHGPDVLMTPSATMDVEEWVSGWIHRDRLLAIGISPPGPLFLHGPTGTGKTSVTRMLARRLDGIREVVVIDAMRVTESLMGATAANISKASDAAIRSGAVLVLEEIDCLASTRQYETGGAVENTRCTTSIMRVLELPGPIILTSNRLDIIDPAVMRRCEYVVEMPPPTLDQQRALIERELGGVPSSVSDTVWMQSTSLSLSTKLAMARRARRSAEIMDVPVLVAFARLIEAQLR